MSLTGPFQDHHATKTIIFTLSPGRKARSSVPQEIWTMNLQSWGLARVTTNFTFQDHPSTKTVTLSTQSSVSQENGLKPFLPETWTINVQSRDFPSVTDALPFKTILPLKLSFQRKALSSGRPEQWTCRAKASPGSLMTGLFKTNLPLNLSLWLKTLSPRRPEQCTFRVEPFPNVTDALPFQDHLAAICIISTQSCSPWSPEQWMCTAKGFPRVTNNWPFQDHFDIKTIALTRSSVLRENSLKLRLQGKWLEALSTTDLNNECAEKRLPRVTNKRPFQNHFATWTIVSTRSCFLGDLNNECADASLVSPKIAFSRPCSQ